MKEYYFSDVLNQMFSDRDECAAAEAKHAKEQVEAKRRKEEADAKRKTLIAEREERKKAVDAAFDAAYKLRDQYVKDYGQYRFEYSLPAYTGSLLDFFGI